MADAVPLAKRTGAPVVAIVEIAHWLDSKGVGETFDPNLGGTVEFDWGWVKLVQAHHTSTIPGSDETPFNPEVGVAVGQAAGLIVHIDGKTVYHAGDTCLFSDMKLLAERHPVDIALLPIGGHYTMDPSDAAYAAGLIGADKVIPMHYNTFPPIEQDPAAFKAEVEGSTDSDVVILEPGESTTV